MAVALSNPRFIEIWCYYEAGIVNTVFGLGVFAVPHDVIGSISRLGRSIMMDDRLKLKTPLLDDADPIVEGV
jgi:hypothetical protein